MEMGGRGPTSRERKQSSTGMAFWRTTMGFWCPVENTLDLIPRAVKTHLHWQDFAVQSLSCGQLFRPHGLQHARLPCPSPSPVFAQTHVHQVGDAIQPSRPLLLPSPPALNPSQHQSLFQWVGSLHQVAKVLGLQLTRYCSVNLWSSTNYTLFQCYIRI